jgi:hypothetical protein
MASATSTTPAEAAQSPTEETIVLDSPYLSAEDSAFQDDKTRIAVFIKEAEKRALLPQTKTFINLVSNRKGVLPQTPSKDICDSGGLNHCVSLK